MIYVLSMRHFKGLLQFMEVKLYYLWRIKNITLREWILLLWYGGYFDQFSPKGTSLYYARQWDKWQFIFKTTVGIVLKRDQFVLQNRSIHIRITRWTISRLYETGNHKAQLQACKKLPHNVGIHYSSVQKAIGIAMTLFYEMTWGYSLVFFVRRHNEDDVIFWSQVKSITSKQVNVRQHSSQAELKKECGIKHSTPFHKLHENYETTWELKRF